MCTAHSNNIRNSSSFTTRDGDCWCTVDAEAGGTGEIRSVKLLCSGKPKLYYTCDLGSRSSSCIHIAGTEAEMLQSIAVSAQWHILYYCRAVRVNIISPTGEEGVIWGLDQVTGMCLLA